MGYVYLGISTVLVTVYALCYKLAAKHGCEMRAVNLWLYIGASAVLVVNLLVTGQRFDSSAAGLGLLTGVGVYISTISFFYHMRTSAITVSWAVIGMAVVFPVLASILWWHEHPTPRQWAGLALIPIAIVLCTFRRGEAPAP